MMFDRICPSCHQNYRIADVKVDKHWNDSSLEPAYCYYPHCNAILRDVYPHSVDFVRHLKLIYIVPFVGFLVFSGIGVLTNTLEYIAPILILCFGAWLAKSAQLKDHRIIGWFLVILSVVVFAAFA